MPLSWESKPVPEATTQSPAATGFCARCGAQLVAGASFCSACGGAVVTPVSSAVPALSGRGYAAAVGMLGIAILVVGVFLPTARFSPTSELNYFNNGQGDGVAMLVLALLALCFVFLPRGRRVLIAIGVLALVLIEIDFMRAIPILTDLKQSLADNPYADVGSITLMYGWAVLVVGAGLLVVAGAMPGLALPVERRVSHQRDIPSSRQFFAVAAVVAVLVVLAIARSLVPGLAASRFVNTKHSVVFTADVQTGIMSLTWTAGDHSESQPNTGGPWSWTVPSIASGTPVSVHVQGSQDSPTTRCTISVDGKQIASQEAAGAYATVECSGRVP
jgi:hypothetical protein